MPVNKRSPRPAREAVMARIRSAAIAEFSAKGLAGTSTHAIAQRAGLTKPQLHYYIRGKDELYQELLMSVVSDWRAMFNTRSDDPVRVLGDYIRAKINQAFEQPEISRMFTREVLDGGENLAKFWPDSRRRTREKVAAIERWIAAGLIEPVDPHTLLLAIWAMTQFYADSALQVQKLLRPAKPGWAPERETLIVQLTVLVLRACGIERPLNP